jgi:hypothetical protein
MGVSSPIRGKFMKKMEAENLLLISLSGKFFISLETDSSKNIFG